MGMWSAVSAHVSSGPQNSSRSASASCINVRSIVLSWVPLFQVGSPVKVVKTISRVASSLSR